MSAVLISTKGQIVLPVAVRNALSLKPGMRVHVKVEGKGARLTPAAQKKTMTIEEVAAPLKYRGPPVPIEAMRVIDYKD
jgi:AbrB family looped-hinge helix DNA binding protein